MQPAAVPAETELRRVPGKPDAAYQRCSGCARRARDLFWLMHVETTLPLTMPLCSDCFRDAANAVAQLLSAPS